MIEWFLLEQLEDLNLKLNERFPREFLRVPPPVKYTPRDDREEKEQKRVIIIDI